MTIHYVGSALFTLCGRPVHGYYHERPALPTRKTEDGPVAGMCKMCRNHTSLR